MKKIKFEQPKAFRPRSAPKTSHPGKNLGKFLHKSKMPTGAKIGSGAVAKTTKRKSTKVKGY